MKETHLPMKVKGRIHIRKALQYLHIVQHSPFVSAPPLFLLLKVDCTGNKIPPNANPSDSDISTKAPR